MGNSPNIGEIIQDLTLIITFEDHEERLTFYKSGWIRTCLVSNNGLGLNRGWYDGPERIMWFEVPYKNYKQHGTKNVWYESMRLKYTTRFVDGEQIGPVLGWYDNEQHRLKYEITYKNGKQNGLGKRWADEKNAKTELVMYMEGKRKLNLW